MVSWMYNNTKDVKTAIDNTLRVSAPLRPCVKLKNNNAKTQRRDGAKNKNLWVYFTGIFDCAPFVIPSSDFITKFTNGRMTRILTGYFLASHKEITRWN
ncbi:MAG: hypothetical protein U9N46_11665 [Euryarchaeota archaeon]|nr:MAG: hypothetical protein C5S47_08020 [ANME-2 cluster archaeon]MEA1865821.1 hypothetical protein [Euryarchaeota archaeon]